MCKHGLKTPAAALQLQASMQGVINAMALAELDEKAAALHLWDAEARLLNCFFAIACATKTQGEAAQMRRVATRVNASVLSARSSTPEVRKATVEQAALLFAKCYASFVQIGNVPAGPVTS